MGSIKPGKIKVPKLQLQVKALTSLWIPYHSAFPLLNYRGEHVLHYGSQRRWSVWLGSHFEIRWPLAYIVSRRLKELKTMCKHFDFIHFFKIYMFTINRSNYKKYLAISPACVRYCSTTIHILHLRFLWAALYLNRHHLTKHYKQAWLLFTQKMEIQSQLCRCIMHLNWKTPLSWQWSAR